MSQRAIYETGWQAYLLAAPILVLSVVFAYYPALDTFRLSLYETRALGIRKTYVGLQNFAQLFTSGEFYHSLLVSCLFAVVVVVGTLAAALYIGFLVHEVNWGSSTYLVAAIWPYALPLAVSAVVLMFLLHPTVGIVTYLLTTTLHIGFDWLNDPYLAFGVVSLATIWKLIGYNIIFVVGSLSTVPESIRETAELDGIGRFTLLTRVYVPLISPTLAFLVVLNTVEAFFRPFPVIDIMTSGGPGNATELLIYKLYQDAFAYGKLGLASAESIVLFVIAAVLMYLQIRLSDTYAHYG